MSNSNSKKTAKTNKSHLDAEQVINTEIFKGKDNIRSDTPDTLLSDFMLNPDITFWCDVCSEYIDACNLSHHRNYHKALLTLNYSHPLKQSHVNALLQRRNIVLKKLKADVTKKNHLFLQGVERIDAAYELVKSHLENLHENTRLGDHKVDANTRGIGLGCSTDCVCAVGICSSKNSQWKNCMEDVHVYQDYFGEDRDKCYLAIFDGYYGATAAERSGKELHQLLLLEMAKFDSKIKSTITRNFAESVTARMDYEKLRPETRDSVRVNLHQQSTEIVQNIMNSCYEKYDQILKDKVRDDQGKERSTRKTKHPMTEQIHNAFKKAYLLMDILLSYGNDERSKVRWSGTSALTMIIQNVKSNANERKNNIISLDMKNDDSEEISGKITEDTEKSELMGQIHVANAGNSRALLVQGGKPYRLTKDHTADNMKERKRVVLAGGNFSKSKRNKLVNGVLPVTRGLGNHGDKKLKDCVIVDPCVASAPIDQHAQFLVLASGGVWEVFSDLEVANLLVKMLPDHQIPPPSRASESLLPLLHRELEDGRSGSRLNGKSEPELMLQQDQKKPELTISPDLEPTFRTNFSNGDDVHSYNITCQIDDEESLLLPEHSADITDSIQVTNDENRRELAKSMAEYLTQAALLAGAKDNITVIVVLLSGCGI